MFLFMSATNTRPCVRGSTFTQILPTTTRCFICSDVRRRSAREKLGMVATCSVTFASNASSKLLIGNQILFISGQMFSEQRFFAPRTLLRILQLFVGRGDQLPATERLQ